MKEFVFYRLQKVSVKIDGTESIETVFESGKYGLGDIRDYATGHIYGEEINKMKKENILRKEDFLKSATKIETKYTFSEFKEAYQKEYLQEKERWEDLGIEMIEFDLLYELTDTLKKTYLDKGVYATYTVEDNLITEVTIQ